MELDSANHNLLFSRAVELLNRKFDLDLTTRTEVPPMDVRSTEDMGRYACRLSCCDTPGNRFDNSDLGLFLQKSQNHHLRRTTIFVKNSSLLTFY